MECRRWTDDELEKLGEYYGIKDLKSLCRILGRTKLAVQKKASQLGINCYDNNGEYISLAELARVFQIDPKSIKQKWVGVYKLEEITVKAAGKRKLVKFNISDFWKWAERNKDIIDFNRLEKNILANEPKWVDEQRKKIKKYKWTDEEIYMLRILSNKGLSDSEIAAKIGRTEKAVVARRSIIGMRKRSKGWSAKELLKVYQMTKEGYRYKHVAKAVNRSYEAIRNITKTKRYKDACSMFEQMSVTDTLKSKTKA